MSRFAHVSKSNFAMRSDESYVPWANTWYIFEIRKKTASDLWMFAEIRCSLTIWVYRTAGGCSRLRETKIKHPIHRLLRRNHNIIIFEDGNWNEKGICLELLQNVGIGGGDCCQWGRYFCKKLSWHNLFTAWALTENILTAIQRHEYIFIFKSSACSLQQCFMNY